METKIKNELKKLAENSGQMEIFNKIEENLNKALELTTEIEKDIERNEIKEAINEAICKEIEIWYKYYKQNKEIFETIKDYEEPF